MAYKMLCLYANSGKRNWVFKVKHLLCSTGFGYIWEQQEICNIQAFTSEFVSRLRYCYEQEWHSFIFESSKTCTYSLFKPTFGRELYLSQVNINKFRIALSRFRCGSHSLRVETGRYCKEPLDQRICIFCDKNCIENEYHFLLFCIMYCDIREKYLEEKYYKHPTIHKFNMLMSSTNVTTLRNLSMFLYYANLKRNNVAD